MTWDLSDMQLRLMEPERDVLEKNRGKLYNKNIGLCLKM